MQFMWDLRSSTCQNYVKKPQILRTGLTNTTKKKSLIWGVITARLKVCLKCIHMVEQQQQLHYIFKCWVLVWCWASVGFKLWGNKRFSITGSGIKKSLNDCRTHLWRVERGQHTLWLCVFRWVCLGVITQASQHGGDFSHFTNDIIGDLPHPLGESVSVDRLHHLVCGAFHPAQTERTRQEENRKKTD